MYCPKCSQQQVSEEMRFCSRCGFPLSVVAALLQNDGVVPLSILPPVKKRSSRKAIMLESAVLTIFAWLIAVLAINWFDMGGPQEAVAKVASLVFFTLGIIALLRFLYGFLFAKDSTRTVEPLKPGERDALSEGKYQALPEQRTTPEPSYVDRRNTKEMTPASVTESTTRLLDEDQR